MTQKIPVCPDCDSARLYARSGRHNGESGWRCDECGEIKDRIAYRERKGDYGFSPDTLAHELWKMDPDEV